MRAAGLLLPLLLLGVNSQNDADSATPGQPLTNKATETTTMTTTASTRETSTATPASSPTTLQTSTTALTQPAEVPTNTAQSSTTNTNPGTSPSPPTTSPTTGTSSTTNTNPGTPPSPPTTSPTTVITTGPLGTSSSATTTPPHTSGQDSSSHGTTTPKTSPAASPTHSQLTSTATAGSGSLGTTTAAKAVTTNATSPPGTAGTSPASTQPQEKQPLAHVSSTTVSTTAPRTDPSRSSKESPVPTPQRASPGSTSPALTPPTGSPSLATTLTSQPGSKDTVTKAATTAPGADQTTHDAGSATAKPTSASQSPATAQPPAPASGNQTDQTRNCSSDHQQTNTSFPNKLICEKQVQHTRPTIQLKEPRTCEEWRTASKTNSFFESFCSTAQHVFNASRDGCTVILMASECLSHHWAVRVVLHLPLDSEEVLNELKEKKDKLEELGIVNITSDKMVEDMTINDEFSTPLIITIITLAASLLLAAAIYGCHQRFSKKKDQNIHPDVPGFDDGHVALIFNQRLTEEMQTMENGYHDNPTLEVMETSSEMQEKKVNLNGELGDSWIVPLDTLMKEDLEEEEDTHL